MTGQGLRLDETIEHERPTIARDMVDLMRLPAFGATGEGYPEIAAFLAGKMNDAGLHVETIDVPHEFLVAQWGRDLGRTVEYLPVQRFAGRPIVFGRRRGTRPGSPSLHLTQHYDLPGYQSSAFSASPVQLRDDQVYAAGASRCRAGIVAMLAAARALIQTNAPFAGDLFLSFTPDNHLGGETGAGYLVGQGIGRSDLVITGSAGGPDTLVLGYKGAVWAKVTTRGVSALASEPHRGLNAIDKMAVVQRALSNLDTNIRTRSSAWPLVPPELARPTLVQSRIASTGVGVPDICTLYVDRRLTPEESVSGALDEIREALHPLRLTDPDLTVDLDMVHGVEPAATDPSVPLAAALTRNIRAVLGVEPRMELYGYYTEFRLFAHEWGSQVVNYSPGRHEHNGEAEHVSVSDITAAAHVLALTVRDMVG